MEDPHTLLEEYRRIHAGLLAAADAFEAMIHRPEPDDVLLTTVRYKLTSSNSRRHAMLERVIAALGPLSPGDQERVRQARAESVAGMLRSSQFIAQWSMREIARDWRGYVSASLGIPNSVRANVRNEQRVFYPLLAEMPRAVA